MFDFVTLTYLTYSLKTLTMACMGMQRTYSNPDPHGARKRMVDIASKILLFQIQRTEIAFLCIPVTICSFAILL
jgi:hypothetical protein